MDQVVALPEYRAGILAISHCHVARFAEFLPSEHRIAARNDHEGFTEFLVEGRTLPVVPAGATPGEVILILTLEPNLKFASASLYVATGTSRETSPGMSPTGPWPNTWTT